MKISRRKFLRAAPAAVAVVAALPFLIPKAEAKGLTLEALKTCNRKLKRASRSACMTFGCISEAQKKVWSDQIVQEARDNTFWLAHGYK